MIKNKKEWVTPELIILVRNKPEEAVLTTCKSAGTNGPDSAFSYCGVVTSCIWCTSEFTS